MRSEYSNPRLAKTSHYPADEETAHLNGMHPNSRRHPMRQAIEAYRDMDPLQLEPSIATAERKSIPALQRQRLEGVLSGEHL